MPEYTDPAILKAKLNNETATIAWRSLQRFFAAGNAISVTRNLDLVTVAAEFSQDNATQLKQWMEDKSVHPVTDSEATRWYEQDALVWAVVVSPWVLVQEVET